MKHTFHLRKTSKFGIGGKKGVPRVEIPLRHLVEHPAGISDSVKLGIGTD